MQLSPNDLSLECFWIHRESYRLFDTMRMEAALLTSEVKGNDATAPAPQTTPDTGRKQATKHEKSLKPKMFVLHRRLKHDKVVEDSF
eukprot:1912190-Amphidinium_carterae.1